MGAGPIVHIYDLKNSSTTLAKTVEALNRNAQHFTCYQYQDLPSRLNSSSNNRIGDIACLAKSGWNIGFDSRQPIGNHGWDQFESRDMDGVFFAQGKLFKPGFIQPTAENIHVMPLLAEMLGLTITHQIDGDSKQLAPLLRNNPTE